MTNGGINLKFYYIKLFDTESTKEYSTSDIKFE